MKTVLPFRIAFVTRMYLGDLELFFFSRFVAYFKYMVNIDFGALVWLPGITTFQKL